MFLTDLINPKAVDALFSAVQYVKYLFNRVDEHKIHSPFVFELYNNVIANKAFYYHYFTMQELETALRNDHSVLQFHKAGSSQGMLEKASVAEIYSKQAISEKYGKLLFRLANYFQPTYTVELGTNLGVSSAWLMLGCNTQKLYTIEAVPLLLQKAHLMWHSIEAGPINAKEGNADEVLPELLSTLPHVDMAYIDANHLYHPTMKYFELLLTKCHENSLLIFDDIHWSQAMHQAWKDIQQHPDVTLTIDLFRLGLVFFKQGRAKEHFVLKY